MAHYEKFTAGAVGHMCAHFDRQKNSDGEYVRYGNREIDPERIHLNYNIHDDARSSMEIYKERIAQLKYMKRDDVIMMASCIVTAPSDLEGNQTIAPEHERQFFQASYDELCRRHGKENVISAWVHCDEAGKSHMHFAFVPAVVGRKKRRGKDEYYTVEKICYDEAVDRSKYQSLHPDLVSAVAAAEEKAGVYLGSKEVMNGVVAENGRNYTVAQLKRLEAALNDEILQAQQQAQELLQETHKAIEENQKVIQNQTEQSQALNRQIGNSHRQFATLQTRVENQRKQWNQLENTLSEKEKGLYDLDKQIAAKQQELQAVEGQINDKRVELHDVALMLNSFKDEREYLAAAKKVKDSFQSTADLLEATAGNPEKYLSLIHHAIKELQQAVQSVLSGLIGYELVKGIPLEKRQSEAILHGLDGYIKQIESRSANKQQEHKKTQQKEHDRGR